MSEIHDLETTHTLRRAAALLRANQHTHGRELLGELIRTHPGFVEAHRLIAGSYFQTGDFVRAQKATRAWLRLAPENAEAHGLLGQILAAGGQHAEAESAFREALGLDAKYLPAAVALTRLLLTRGRAADACDTLEPFARGKAATPEVWRLYGVALASLGKPNEAVEWFQRAVEQEPDNPEVRLGLAAALADDDRGAAAEVEVRRVIARGFDSGYAAFVLARALMGQGRFAEAEIELQKAVRTRPDHATAQANLSELVWMRSGDVEKASAALDAALQVNPDHAALRIVKSRLLLSAGRTEDALALIEAGLARAPDALELLNTASSIALDFDPASALGFARRALRVAPNDSRALAAFGNASLGVGEAQEALATAEVLQQRDPRDGQSLAMQADALRLLENPRYHDLLDYQHFLRAEFIDTPVGWPDLAVYLADLVAALKTQHSRRAHPIGNSLRQGSQLELIPDRSPYPAIRAFPLAIEGPIRRYLHAMGSGDDPMRRRNSGTYRIQGMWSVRLRPHGFHVNHYHPLGWISSACYLQLPPAAQEPGGGGWLKFGEPPFPTVPKLKAEYFLKPLPGLLALFPSYMWHGTVPFAGEPGEGRLTIAFDLLPGQEA